MTGYNHLPRLSLGIYPTPFYKLEAISARYGREIWIKRDDLCGVALGGNKVRKLEYLLAKAQADGCDTVFTTGGAQSNHAMLTAACAARLGMKAVLLLKQRGVTEHLGNLVLDDLYGAQVRLVDTDDYQDIYREMDRLGAELAQQGHKCCPIPVGGSTALGAVGYVHCVEELAAQTPAGVRIDHIVSATGSGGTTAGLLLGSKRFLSQAKVTGIGVDDDPFDPATPCPIRRTPRISRSWPGPRAFCWTRCIPARPGQACCVFCRRESSPETGRWPSSTPAARRRCSPWTCRKLNTKERTINHGIFPRTS